MGAGPAADLCLRPREFQRRAHQSSPRGTRLLSALLAGQSDRKRHDGGSVVASIVAERTLLRIAGLSERERLATRAFTAGRDTLSRRKSRIAPDQLP